MLCCSQYLPGGPRVLVVPRPPPSVTTTGGGVSAGGLNGTQGGNGTAGVSWGRGKGLDAWGGWGGCGRVRVWRAVHVGGGRWGGCGLVHCTKPCQCGQEEPRLRDTRTHSGASPHSRPRAPLFTFLIYS